MYFFFLVPITCCHSLSPAALVASSNTTVPVVTKPPAVIGQMANRLIPGQEA